MNYRRISILFTFLTIYMTSCSAQFSTRLSQRIDNRSKEHPQLQVQVHNADMLAIEYYLAHFQNTYNLSDTYAHEVAYKIERTLRTAHTRRKHIDAYLVHIKNPSNYTYLFDQGQSKITCPAPAKLLPARYKKLPRFEFARTLGTEFLGIGAAVGSTTLVSWINSTLGSLSITGNIFPYLGLAYTFPAALIGIPFFVSLGMYRHKIHATVDAQLCAPWLLSPATHISPGFDGQLLLFIERPVNQTKNEKISLSFAPQTLTARRGPFAQHTTQLRHIST